MPKIDLNFMAFSSLLTIIMVITLYSLQFAADARPGNEFVQLSGQRKSDPAAHAPSNDRKYDASEYALLQTSKKIRKRHTTTSYVRKKGMLKRRASNAKTQKMLKKLSLSEVIESAASAGKSGTIKCVPVCGTSGECRLACNMRRKRDIEKWMKLWLAFKQSGRRKRDASANALPQGSSERTKSDASEMSTLSEVIESAATAGNSGIIKCVPVCRTEGECKLACRMRHKRDIEKWMNFWDRFKKQTGGRRRRKRDIDKWMNMWDRFRQPPAGGRK